VLLLTALLLVITTFATAQGDRGTITGTVTDPKQAMVVGAAVTARSSEGGAPYETRSTDTGNFTLPQMPAGVYDVTISAPGFSKFVQKGIRVQVAMTARVDVQLQVGSTSESITVTADAPLLRTEDAEQSATISSNRVDSLPLNFGGASGDIGSMRNGLAFMLITPGVSANGLDAFSGYSVNGAPGGSFRILVEGQDSTGSNSASIASDEVRPAIDAIQEYTMQTSNYAAEYGQVNGGVMNFTAKSGGSQFHGGAYEYLVNEALAAHYPFTGARPKARKNDYGGFVGGPVIIPKLYNGRDRTFFFFNYEKYHNQILTSGRYASVPTADYRTGNFSSILGTASLNTDPLGRSIVENAIYNPTTDRVVNGLRVRDVFPNNTIPITSIDPVAKKIQALIPNPSIPGIAVNNFEQIALDLRNQYIPSIKIDHSITSKAKLAFFWSYFNNHRWSNREGLPDPISAWRDQKIYSHVGRLSYDHALMPTLLLHAGVGYMRYMNPDSSPPSVLSDYDAAKNIGWNGGAVTGFPRIQNLGSSWGGMSLGMGPTNANLYYNDKFTSVLSAMYIRNNHSYKIGGEFRIDIWTDRGSRGSTGVMNFDAAQTGLPISGLDLQGKSVGFPYASFLLGMVHDGYVNGVQDPQLRKHAYGLFVQDTWKITRKLTLDYGLRWDYESMGHEIHYRMSMFGPTIKNPSAGNLPGAMAYEGYGPGRCNCEFTTTYPYAVQPRLGAAYQLDPKTVFRAGWGLTYASTADFGYMTNSAILGVGFNADNFSSPGYGDYAFLLVNGPQYNKADLYAASFDPGLRPSPGQLDSPSQYLDRNGGRPGRINQWNISVQREIIKDLLVEAAYVGNRGVWLQGGWGDTMVTLNSLTTARIRAAGLDINNAADRAVLTAPLSSSIAQSRGFTAPYAGYPMSATVAQTLRPFPQYSDISVKWAPLGSTWYDSLQMKATKRFSHGLESTAAFTWQKQLSAGAGGGSPNDLFNRRNQKSFSASSQPLILAVALNYQTPGLAAQNRILHALSRDWTVGGILRYASGMPIAVPGSQNQLGSLLFQNTRMNRVPGQPLFLKDLNCGCIDPNKDFVLNPAAWSDAPAGSWGYSAAFYNDYRQARIADEQLSLGRVFRIRERMSLQIRAEFFNVFNRIKLASPDSGNPLSTQFMVNGVPMGGFGRIDATQAGSPRNGQLVARFLF
jgi:hypothetical protein